MAQTPKPQRKDYKKDGRTKSAHQQTAKQVIRDAREVGELGSYTAYNKSGGVRPYSKPLGDMRSISWMIKKEK